VCTLDAFFSQSTVCQRRASSRLFETL
jgi:hypothetical protein